MPLMGFRFFVAILLSRRPRVSLRVAEKVTFTGGVTIKLVSDMSFLVRRNFNEEVAEEDKILVEALLTLASPDDLLDPSKITWTVTPVGKTGWAGPK